jgi:predicted Zn-dependent protease
MSFSAVLAVFALSGVLGGAPVATPAQDEQTAKAQVQKTDPKHEADLKRDAEMGKEYAAEADKEFKASTNREMIERVLRISDELVAIANSMQVEVLWGDPRLNPFEYQFKVVEGKDVNAFSLPGGFIYVFEGLLDYVQSDDELAGVLAHEIAHASQRHLATLAREQSKFDAFSLPLVLVALLSGGDVGYGAVVLRDLANLAGRSGWSQKAESAADHSALQYLRHSKYNPVGLLTFMERLASEKSGLDVIDLGILRSHPPSRVRAEQMTAYLNKLQIPIKRSLVTTSYRVTAVPGDDGTVEIKFGSRRLTALSATEPLTRVDEAVRRLNDFFDTVPELYELRVDGEGRIIGKGRVLLALSKADADASHLSLEELRSDTVQAIKRSLNMLAFRIWDVR